MDHLGSLLLVHVGTDLPKTLVDLLLNLLSKVRVIDGKEDGMELRVLLDESRPIERDRVLREQLKTALLDQGAVELAKNGICLPLEAARPVDVLERCLMLVEVSLSRQKVHVFR